MIVSLVVAVSKDNVIGNDGVIPWKIPGEQKRFKDLTTGKTIIIGRKSFEEIGKPLPNRKTIVVSRTQDFIDENCIAAKSLQEAFEFSKDEDEVFIAGGGQLYKDALPFADRIYITVIEESFKGNVHFPDINREDFEKTSEQRVEGLIPYTYYTFEKRAKKL